jgi:hypothetical protein
MNTKRQNIIKNLKLQDLAIKLVGKNAEDEEAQTIIEEMLLTNSVARKIIKKRGNDKDVKMMLTLIEDNNRVLRESYLTVLAELNENEDLNKMLDAKPNDTKAIVDIILNL